MDAFPAFYPLAGRRVVIAGHGEAAEAKARLFAGSPAQVVRVQDDAAFDPASYRGAVLAFVATADEAFAARASAAARVAGTPVNVADQPALCDFMTPAVVDRGAVVAAVGTGGAAPLLASLLRADIDARVPEGAGWAAALLHKLQAEVRAAFPQIELRRAFLRAALDSPAAKAAMSGDMEMAEMLMRADIAAGVAQIGKVRFIVGAGPAEALTLRAARVLAEADVLAMDAAVDHQVAALTRRDARRLTPDEASPQALAQMARRGLQVVRLTSREAAAEFAAVQAQGVCTESVT